MKLITLLLLFAAAGESRTLRIQVLAPFRLTQLNVRAPEAQIGGAILAGAPEAELKAVGSTVKCRTGAREVQGALFTSKGPVVTLELPGGPWRRYQGALEVSAAGDILQAVLLVDLEVAVASVVAAEMPGAPLEARKSQAVAARSYYSASPRRHREFDFCDSTHCQFLRESPADSDAAAQASADTRGLTLSWEGSAFGAMYFRSCGGRTFAAQSVKLDSAGYPYFSVACEKCRRNPHRWRFRAPAAEVSPLLEHGPSEVGRVMLGRKLGWSSLQSNDYTTEAHGGQIEFSGRGEGHGVGLCQRGAKAMAAAGYDFAAILQHYYPNSSVTPAR